MVPVSYLTAPSPVGVVEANQVFAALDEALSVLFNGQSPLLYQTHAEWKAAGLAGLLAVFGTQASRNLFPSTASYDQAAFDTAVSAATILGQDDSLKQVELDMTADALSACLRIMKRTVTPPTGPDEDYFVKVEFMTGYYHHERRHDLAAVDVVFEGHAGRTFTWEEQWDKCRCLRFHNLDADTTPLVITMENTGDTFSLGPWECIAVRLSEDESEWVEEGFVFWRMRDEDFQRIGNSMPWNDRRRALAGETSGSVWFADGANNVASWALVCHLLDHYAIATTPGEVSEVGAGVADAFEPKTGFSFDLSDITRNAGTLKPFPDPTSSSTKLYQLGWHGGQMLVATKETAGATTLASGAPTIAGLLAGDPATGLTLEIDPGGSSAHLKLTDETGLDYADVVPIGTNLGASGHPFTVPADGVGYTVPYLISGWDGINRLMEVDFTETIAGIGTTVSNDYVRLDIENSNATYGDLLAWTSFGGTIGDVQGWAFHDGTKNNAHGTFLSNSVKFDGRVVSVNTKLRIVPDGGAYIGEVAARRLALLDASTPAFTTWDWYQAAPVQSWPPSGGPWLTPRFVRRSMPPVDPAFPVAHPNAQQYLGTPAGDDYTMRGSQSFTRSRGIKRQLPLNDVTGEGLDSTSAELTGCYFQAEDSTQEIVEHFYESGWWVTNRVTAISGAAIGGEVRPVIAPVLCARHFNVIAQRINAILSVVPFSFFDAVYYGREFRPDYSSGGIFGGHVYPIGFVCYSTGTAATRAADLGVTVRDFQTEHSYYGALSAIDVDIIDATGPGGVTSGRGFDVALGTPFDAWNMDIPYWMRATPSPALARNESVVIASSSPGSGWVQGELVFSTVGPAVDWYAYYLPNDSAYAFPDFDYLTATDLKSVADGLGIPFRLVRLCSVWQLYGHTPDRQGIGVRYVPQFTPSNQWTRTEIRLVPAFDLPSLVMFAGTEEEWGGNGMVRVSDWAPFPGTQGSDDPVIQQSNADPMHGFDRTGTGWTVEFPHGYYPATGSTSPGWRNSNQFEGEALHLTLEVFDETPVPPTGWDDATHRLGSYPVPATQWGATDIEAHPAPSCDPAWIRTSDLPSTFDASDLWSQQGSGAWNGQGGFAVHLIPGAKTVI